MEGGLGVDMGLNTAAPAGESQEVTNEDMVRVSESMKQAALMGGQIKGDQQKNSQIAKFLEFLFSEVKSDSLREIIVELCSKTDSAGMNMTLAIPELVLIFAPFFPHQIQEYGLHVVFPHIPSVSGMGLDAYIAYFREVRQYYPLMQQMDADTVSALMIALMDYFGYGSADPEKKNEILEAIKTKLG